MRIDSCCLLSHVHTLSPTLGGQAVTYLEARRIVLKMLAVLSSHSKMQSELAKEATLKLLVAACKDNSLENVTNSLITLANVARNTGSHGLVMMSLLHHQHTITSL